MITLGEMLDLRALSALIAPTIERQITTAQPSRNDGDFARTIANNVAQVLCDIEIGQELEAGAILDQGISALRIQAMRLAEADPAHLRNDAMAFASQSALVISSLREAVTRREEMLATRAAESRLLRELVADLEDRLRRPISKAAF